MEAVACSGEASVAISKFPRIALWSNRGTWDVHLAEEQSGYTQICPLIQYMYPISVPAPCPSSGFPKKLAF